MASPELNSAKQMLDAYRGNRVLAVTIPYDEWKRGTDAGLLKVRSSELEAIDSALREYHEKGKTEASFVRLRQAFETWTRAQQLAGKVWTQSERNRSGLVSKLHEQLTLVEAGRSVKNMGSADWEARMALVEAERDAMTNMFKGRQLLFKTPYRSGLAHIVQQYATGIGATRAASNLVKGSSGQVTGQTVATAFNKIGGVAADHLSSFLGVSADALCSACASVINFGVAPVKLLNDMVNAGMGIKARVDASRGRFAFSQGNADAALDAVIRQINQELLIVAKEMAQHTASIVATAFAAGPIFTAANSVVDLIVNNALYVQMTREMKAGNEMLSRGRYGLDLFQASPVLGCYFLVRAETNVWVNFSVHDMGTEGWTRQVDAMVRRADPVRDKARELIRNSKYGVSGLEGFNGLEWEASWRNNKLAYMKKWMKRIPAVAASESYRVFG